MLDTPAPTPASERTTNPLRPARLADVIGQAPAKKLLARAIDAAFEHRHPLDHVLLAGSSGTGKTTLAHVVATELGVDVYQLAAPVSFDTLVELRTEMRPGAVLFIDEVHLQAIAERRGKESISAPEVLFGVMEDRTLTTPTGVLPFPAVTIIGATTDPGRLPEAFLNRFPLRPRLVDYSHDELVTIAQANAAALNVAITDEAADVLARASAGVPRQVNNLVRNARLLAQGAIARTDALEALDINGISEDGLTPQMQQMLTFLYTRAQRRTGRGEVVYQASVNTIATAIGLSRDTKAVSLYVEPYLIKRGFVQVGHGGRLLTDAGVARARELA